MMHWEQLLSLKRFGDTRKRLRTEQDDTRLGFEVDYDRVIFSSAFRSLQDKTQVIPLSKTDFVHTRLTHSLEVSVVGRSLGRITGKKILEKYPHLKTVHGYHFNDFGAIVAAAALAHDIGNPPFGHSGEKAIGAWFKSGQGEIFKNRLTPSEFQDLTDFEGNANGFKTITESREGVPGGLRLSYATLGAFLKYPKGSLPQKPSSHIAHKKFSVFQSEKDFFQEVASDLGLLKTGKGVQASFCRHPLVYLVEAADDICYTIIDFEDGINLGLVPEEYALEYLIKLVKDTINTAKYSSLQTPEDRISYLRALAINTLIEEASNVFMENEDAILNGSFEWALLQRSAYKAQVEDILALSVKRIYQSENVIEKEISGYAIIGKLMDVYAAAVLRTFDGAATPYDKLLLKTIPEKYTILNTSLYQAILNVCCFIASLTDGKVVALYHKISGWQM